MKYLMLILLIAFLSAWKDNTPKNKTYRVYISTQEYHPSMSKRLAGTEIDSVVTNTDSAA